MFAPPTFRDMLVIVEDYAAENGIMRRADNTLRWSSQSRRPQSRGGWWRWRRRGGRLPRCEGEAGCALDSHKQDHHQFTFIGQ